MAAEIVGDEVAAPVLGHMPAAEDLAAAVFRMAGIETVQKLRRPRRGFVARSHDHRIDALGTGAVGDERLAPTIEVMAPRVPPAAREHFEPARLRTKLPNAAAAQTARAIRRFDVRVNIDGLIE